MVMIYSKTLVHASKIALEMKRSPFHQKCLFCYKNLQAASTIYIKNGHLNPKSIFLFFGREISISVVQTSPNNQFFLPSLSDCHFMKNELLVLKSLQASSILIGKNLWIWLGIFCFANFRLFLWLL